MISKQHIQTLINEVLDGTELFLVDLAVKPSNKIIVEIDSFKGVTIDECAQVSLSIKGKLDRNVEDFELEVSSPGLGNPFKVIQQYEKNLGKQVSSILKNGGKITGKLVDVSQEGIKIETSEKVKKEGKKKPELEIVANAISFSDIKSTKVIINF